MSKYLFEFFVFDDLMYSIIACNLKEAVLRLDEDCEVKIDLNLYHNNGNYVYKVTEIKFFEENPYKSGFDNDRLHM